LRFIAVGKPINSKSRTEADTAANYNNAKGMLAPLGNLIEWNLPAPLFAFFFEPDYQETSKA